MTDIRLTFKDMCAKFDVTPRTLRYYEYIELLSPEKEGRARFYGPREVARMTLILRGRRFGFSLEEIRQWLLIYGKKGEKPQLEHWLTMADRHTVMKHGMKELADAAKDLNNPDPDKKPATADSTVRQQLLTYGKRARYLLRNADDSKAAA